MTISTSLDQLRDAGLIRLADGEPDPEYLFRHTLLQETAYRTLLRQERSTLHLSVGRALERMYPQQRDELAPILGEHFDQGGEPGRAMTYFTLSGEGAARVHAVSVALGFFERALGLALQGHGGAEDIAHLYTRRGRMLELSGEYGRAVENYGEMEAAGEELDQPNLSLKGLVLRANLFCIPSSVADWEKGEALSREALEFAQSIGDPESEARALWNLMLVCQFREDPEKAITFGERALALTQAQGLKEQTAFVLNDLASAYLMAGRGERALSAGQQARSLWEELDNLPMLVDSLSNAAGYFVFAGKYQKAIQLSEEAGRISDKIENDWGRAYSLYVLPIAYSELGELQRAIDVGMACIDFAEKAGFIVPLVQTRAEMASVYAYLGQFQHAHRLLEESLHQAERAQMANWRAVPLAMTSLCHTLSRDLERAEQFLQAALGVSRSAARLSLFSPGGLFTLIAEAHLRFAQADFPNCLEASRRLSEGLSQNGFRLLVSDGLWLQGKALLAQDQLEAAGGVLEKAEQTAQEIGSQRTLWMIRATQAELAARRGEHAGAEQRRAKAAEGVGYITEKLTDETLRNSFLGLPEVRAVLEP